MWFRWGIKHLFLTSSGLNRKWLFRAEIGSEFVTQKHMSWHFQTIRPNLNKFNFSWQFLLWLIDGQTPNLPKIFLYVWWKQLLIYLILFVSALIAISVGYLIDWGMFDEPKENCTAKRIRKLEEKNSDIDSESELSSWNLIKMCLFFKLLIFCQSQ